LLLPVVPAGAGGTGRSIRISKVVEGDGPGGPYTVQVDCAVEDDSEFEIADGETVPIQVGNQTGDSCVVTEIETQGSTVSYECTVVNAEGICGTDNQTVSWQGDSLGDVEVVITNTFDPATTTTTAPSTTTTGPAAAPAAAVVVATPAFTG
jgi:hypothetical protein